MRRTTGSSRAGTRPLWRGLLMLCLACFVLPDACRQALAADQLIWELTGAHLINEAAGRINAPMPPVQSRDVEAWIRALALTDTDSEAIRALHDAMAQEYAEQWVRANERLKDAEWASRLAPGSGTTGDDPEAIMRAFGIFVQSWHERFLDDFQLLLPTDRAEAWERVQRMAFRRRVMGFIGARDQRGVLLNDWLEPKIEQLPPDRREAVRLALDEYLAELDPLLDRASSAGGAAHSAVAEYRRKFPNEAFSYTSHHDTSTPEGRQAQSLRDAANRAALLVLERHDAVLNLNSRTTQRLVSLAPGLIDPEMAELMRPRQRPLSHDSVFPLSHHARFVPALRLIDPETRWVDEAWIRYRGTEPNQYSQFAARQTVRRKIIAEVLPAPSERQREAFDAVAEWHAKELQTLAERYRSLYPTGDVPSNHGEYRAVRAEGVFLSFAGRHDMARMAELNRQQHAALMEKAAELREALQELTERRLAIEAEAMQRLRAACSFEQRLAIAPY